MLRTASTANAVDFAGRRQATGAAEPASDCGLLTPYRASSGVRRSKGVPMTGTDDVDHVSSFLHSAARGPAALLIEGEVGIGKTTAWLAATESARLAGFRVLSARASHDESDYAFGVASELIADVEAEFLDWLPPLQRTALERHLRLVSAAPSADEQRAVVAAFTAVVKKLSDTSPVLIAVDDVQWIDVASRNVLAFAARRLHGPVGLLLTERPVSDGAAAWLRLDGADGLSRMRIRPMDQAGLQRLVTDRVGRAYTRQTMTRIAEVSGGNPFFALELARAVTNPTTSASAAALPPALADIMRRRVGRFDDEVKRALLAAACVSDPTVDVMAAMTSTSVDRLVRLLEEPETHGIVTIDGNRVRFTHPVLAYGVYSQALPAHRRRMHRALADLESTPEQRARHMALAVVSADPETLAALDVAAKLVDVNGDPVAAAELVELAIGLGGGTPTRRLDAARHHLTAGNLDRSRALAHSAAAFLPAGEQRADARLLIARGHLCDGDFRAAADVLAQASTDAAKQPALLLQVNLFSAMAHSSLGDGDAAHRHSVQAMTRAEQLEDPHLISQALAVHVAVQYRRGLGLDRASLDRAMALEDLDADTPAPFSARVADALALAWAGRLAEADDGLRAAIERRAARGADSDLPWLQFHAAMVAIGLGRYADAARTAEDVLLRAEQLGSAHVRKLATAPSVLVAVLCNHEGEARTAIESVLAETSTGATWPTTALGFLEVSLGNHARALKVLQPLLSRWQGPVDVDVAGFHFVPDAVEAMLATNALDEAEELVISLETNGARLNHPWMSAVGGRCRSMLLASRGELEAAERTAVAAVADLAALPAPFECARTQLVLGQVRRRLRRRQAARLVLEEALRTFEGLGTPIWVERAAAELDRVTLLKGRESDLTPAELRVAELAATGMTNKAVAAALFISPKTVECNLGRVYRKLGIRGRVELRRSLNADGLGSADA